MVMVWGEHYSSFNFLKIVPTLIMLIVVTYIWLRYDIKSIIEQIKVYWYGITAVRYLNYNSIDLILILLAICCTIILLITLSPLN